MPKVKVGCGKQLPDISMEHSGSNSVTSLKVVSPSEYDNHIQRLLSELHVLLRETNSKREKSLTAIEAIEEASSKVKSDHKPSKQNQNSKLKTLYSNLLTESEAEEAQFRKCLHVIASIKALRNEKRIACRIASTNVSVDCERPRAQPIRRGALMMLLHQNANYLPLYIGRPNEEPPALCGAVPAEDDHICKIGDLVAAKVKTANQDAENFDEDNSWILAEVFTYDDTSKSYEVEDIDEEQKERYSLSAKLVIPLPMYKANPETDPDALFPVGALVLALYPQTTCFYQGVICQLPVVHQDPYYVKFEDSSYPDGYSPGLPVPQKYVVSCAELTS